MSCALCGHHSTQHTLGDEVFYDEFGEHPQAGCNYPECVCLEFVTR